MKIELQPNGIRLILSERNLKVLLSKLTMADSARTIAKREGNITVYVSSEPDDQHYDGRTPGPMHPETEKAIA